MRIICAHPGACIDDKAFSKYLLKQDHVHDDSDYNTGRLLTGEQEAI